MMGKTIYSVMLKSLALKTGQQKLPAEIGRVIISRFSSDTDEQMPVLQETVILCVLQIR